VQKSTGSSLEISWQKITWSVLFSRVSCGRAFIPMLPVCCRSRFALLWLFHFPFSISHFPPAPDGTWILCFLSAARFTCGRIFDFCSLEFQGGIGASSGSRFILQLSFYAIWANAVDALHSIEFILTACLSPESANIYGNWLSFRKR